MARVTIAIVNDALAEPGETVNLALSAPTGGATLGVQPTAVLTIIDDDLAPPVGPAQPIPTISDWAFMLLAGLLAVSAMIRVRRPR